VKPFTFFEKTSLSFSPAASLLFFVLSFVYPTFMVGLEIKTYHLISISLFVLMLFHFVILVRRIKKFKQVPKRKKEIWIGMVTLYFIIGALLYIWKKDDEFYAKNSDI